MSPSTLPAHKVSTCIYCTVKSNIIVISFAVRDLSSGVAYQLCVRRPSVIVLTQVIRRAVALCAVPSVGEHGVGLSRQFRGYFADNPFTVFVLIILFVQALNQARFIFYLKKAVKKSASFGTKSTCDITSCGLHKHLHSLSFEIFSYGRNCKYYLFNKMFMYTRNGCKEMK